MKGLKFLVPQPPSPSLPHPCERTWRALGLGASVKPFQIFNTLTRTVEEFRPGTGPSPDVTFYSCGPTVYLPQHLGNMRAYVFVDTLRRALEFNGYRVRHVMNITDVGHMTSDEDAGEDKIEKTARAEGKTPLEVANFYIAQFKRDCAMLNIELPPDARRTTSRIRRRARSAARRIISLR